MKLYVESVSLQREYELKQKINLLNNVSDKIVFAHPLVKNARKIDLVREMYSDLFKEELEQESIYTRKAREGDELIEFMFELSDELKEEENNKKE